MSTRKSWNYLIGHGSSKLEIDVYHNSMGSGNIGIRDMIERLKAIGKRDGQAIVPVTVT